MSTLFKHLFKRHKYLLFIDQFIVDIYRVNIFKKNSRWAGNCCTATSLFWAIQVYNNFTKNIMGVPHTLVADAGGTDCTLSKGLPYMGSAFFSSIVIWNSGSALSISRTRHGDIARHSVHIFHIQSHLQYNCSTSPLAGAEWQGILMSRSADNLLCLILPQRHHSGTQQTQEWIWWVINTRI